MPLSESEMIARSNKFQEQLNAHVKTPAQMQAMFDSGELKRATPKKPRPNVGKKSGMNGPESRFALQLEAMKRRGEIIDWFYEPKIYDLPGGVTYRPDFIAVINCQESRTIYQYKRHVFEIKVCDKNGKLLSRDRSTIDKFKVCQALNKHEEWTLAVETSKGNFDLRKP